MRTRACFNALTALAVGLLVVGGGIAAADNIQSDGDGVVASTADSNWIVGSVCSGSSATRTVPVYVTRQGSGNVFGNGATVSITGSATAGATVDSGPKTITLPGNWVTSVNGTLSPAATFTVGYTAPATLGGFTRTITFSGTGTDSNNGSLTRTDTLTVSGTTINCDSTPPVITPDVTGSLGDNGWYTSDVALTWSVVDAESVITSRTGCDAVSVTIDQAATAYTCSATSAGGTATESVSIKRDTLAPSVSYTSASGGLGGNGWYTSAVTATFTGTDGLSGPSSTTKTATSSGEGATVAVASPAFTDNAGNTTAAGAASQSFKIDLTDPTATFVGGPADGTGYPFGSVPGAPTCTASDDLSGPNGCSVSGYSTAVGTHTLTATATDAAGRSGTATVSYEVLPFTLSGFYNPVDMNGTWNTVKGGSTVPLKFEVFAGSTEMTSTSVIGASFAAKAIACPNGSTSTDEIEVLSTGGTILRYDTTAGQFIQNWATPKKPGTCWAVTMTTADGTKTAAANFMLR